MLPPQQLLLSLLIALTASVLYLGFGADLPDTKTLTTEAISIAVVAALVSGYLSFIVIRRIAPSPANPAPIKLPGSLFSEPQQHQQIELSSQRLRINLPDPAPQLMIEQPPLACDSSGNDSAVLQSEHAHAYLDQAHTLVLVLNSNGEVLYLNQHGYRLLGYPQESLQGSNWLKFCVPSKEHQRITRALFDYNLSNSLAPLYIEHPVLTADGSRRLIAWNCTHITIDGNADGMPPAPQPPTSHNPVTGPTKGTRQLLCSGLDITENRATQDTLVKLSCAVEQSSTAVMIFDCDGIVEYINPAFTLQTGFQVDEVIGHKPNFLESDETDRQTLFQLRRTILRGHNWQGDICYRKKDGQHFWAKERISPIKDDTQSISHYVSVSEDITAERRHQAQIEQLAYHDQLTHLPNRRAFIKLLNSSIELCREQQRTLTLFYLNLDQFKRINDSQGQHAGDQVLCHIAETLRREICKQDLIARYSSDEFLLALHDLSTDQANDFARRINRLVRKPVTIYNGESCEVTTSIGIAAFPENSDQANELIKFADLAMHQVKQADSNGYRFFSQQMQEQLEAKLFLAKELQQAIENDEFILYYQPQIDLENHCVLGMEALVRWQHPQRGMIPPDQFIGVAEQSGLIVSLGQHVIRKACRSYQMLDTLGLGHLRIAINLSALQFRDPLFPRTFKQTLKNYRVNPEQIELELTESMLMTNIEESITILNELKQLGTTLAIDDFGTGYSSLSYLKRLPVDIIKVDRSFVKDIPHDDSDMEITAAVIAMAHKLKLKVVAEGVESAEQVAFLRDNECEYIQGFYYSKPVPESELVAKINQLNQQLKTPYGNCVQLEFES
ncbi:MAG: EAL domain-containing protein [Motiliproteus sp.]